MEGVGMNTRVNTFAVAGVLLLMTGAILLGVFGRQIDDAPPVSVLRVDPGLAGWLIGLHAVSHQDFNVRREWFGWRGEPGEAPGLPVLGAVGYEYEGSHLDLLYAGLVFTHHGYRGERALSIFTTPASGVGISWDAPSIVSEGWGIIMFPGPGEETVWFGKTGRIVVFLAADEQPDLAAIAAYLAPTVLPGP